MEMRRGSGEEEGLWRYKGGRRRGFLERWRGYRMEMGK